MYTVVLMAALTSGSATPDWHPRGGGHHGGCHGSVVNGCSGCYGSCFGCYGGGFSQGGAGLAYGGTCVGTYGGYNYYGPAPTYGCWGAWGANVNATIYQGQGTYGYGQGNGIPGYGVSFQCHGCYGCYGGWSCYGSPTSASGYQLTDTTGPGANSPVAPAPVVIPQSPVPQPMPLKEQVRIRSKVIIEVPENAKLFVDDVLMKAGSGERVFQTPPLSPTETYFYEIRVEVVKDGKTLTDSQRVVIRPGDTITANFSQPGRSDIVTVRANAPAAMPAQE